jgi:hypothetical protein
MSPARQEALTAMLAHVLALPAVQELQPDRRLSRVHYDWLEAGDRAQRTVARLSEQLRRYLDDRAWLENRRIMQLLRDIEHHALALRQTPPEGPVMELDDQAPAVELPTERPLFSPPFKARIPDAGLLDGDGDVAADLLFSQPYVDKSRLEANVRRALQTRRQVTLAQLVVEHPLEQGLAELVGYMSIAAESAKASIDDEHVETLVWTDPVRGPRKASLPLVLFTR